MFLVSSLLIFLLSFFFPDQWQRPKSRNLKKVRDLPLPIDKDDLPELLVARSSSVCVASCPVSGWKKSCGCLFKRPSNAVSFSLESRSSIAAAHQAKESSAVINTRISWPLSSTSCCSVPLLTGKWMSRKQLRRPTATLWKCAQIRDSALVVTCTHTVNRKKKLGYTKNSSLKTFLLQKNNCSSLSMWKNIASV